MYTLGLRFIVIKKYRHYSDNLPVIEYENILKQDFTDADNTQKWCTDITYIHTLKDGWTIDDIYIIASAMDFYSKKSLAGHIIQL